jgi:hypothetical protein
MSIKRISGFLFRFISKTVGTSRDSRDTAYLLALRCPDFLKQSRDSRDRLSEGVHSCASGERKTFAIALYRMKWAREGVSPAAIFTHGRWLQRFQRCKMLEQFARFKYVCITSN